MSEKFEDLILESGELMRRGARSVVNNVGRIVALITLIISALALFTDVKFVNIGAEGFGSTFAVMLVCSYLMFFSMTEAGESSAESSDEYKTALERYKSTASRINGKSIIPLRRFCKKYSEDELFYRKENLLMRHGYAYSDLEAYLDHGTEDARAMRIFKRTLRLKAVSLTPADLLTTERSKKGCELTPPTKKRTVGMLMRLIPSTVCMTLTLSVILTAKDGINPAVVTDALFKLCSIVLVGLKGYVSGYRYKKERATLWLDTKTRLLEAFFSESGSIEKE